MNKISQYFIIIMTKLNNYIVNWQVGAAHPYLLEQCLKRPEAPARAMIGNQGGSYPILGLWCPRKNTHNGTWTAPLVVVREFVHLSALSPSQCSWIGNVRKSLIDMCFFWVASKKKTIQLVCAKVLTLQAFQQVVHLRIRHTLACTCEWVVEVGAFAVFWHLSSNFTRWTFMAWLSCRSSRPLLNICRHGTKLDIKEATPRVHYQIMACVWAETRCAVYRPIGPYTTYIGQLAHIRKRIRRISANWPIYEQLCRPTGPYKQEVPVYIGQLTHMRRISANWPIYDACRFVLTSAYVSIRIRKVSSKRVTFYFSCTKLSELAMV